MIDATFMMRDEVVVARIGDDKTVVERPGMVVGRAHPIRDEFKYDVRMENGEILTNLSGDQLRLKYPPVFKKHVWPTLLASQ